MAEKKVKSESLTREALESKLVDLKKEQMNQRFQLAAGQLPKHMFYAKLAVKLHV